MADRGQDVVQLAALGQRVVDVVGHHDRQPELGGQAGQLTDQPVVVGQQVMGQLDREPVEPASVPLGDRPGPGPIADPQPARDLALATARQPDEALAVRRQQLLAEARPALRPGQVGPRHEPAQAPVARVVTGQQHEMRAARRRPDPPQVRAHDGAMAGQARAVGTRSGRSALARDRGRRLERPCPAPTGPPPAPGRDHDRGRVGRGRVEQLDLDPDDGVQAGRARRGQEPDGAVQPVVVGDRESRQADLERSVDQLVGRGRAVEEREVRVAVQLGVRHRVCE